MLKSLHSLLISTLVTFFANRIGFRIGIGVMAYSGYLLAFGLFVFGVTSVLLGSIPFTRAFEVFVLCGPLMYFISTLIDIHLQSCEVSKGLSA